MTGVIFLETTAAAFAAKGVIKNSTAGGSSNITAADLGAENPGILPTSPFYFLKEWGRGLERFLTFNPIKKAEVELRVANEKAAEALKVQEENPDNAEALAAAIENYTSAEERLQARLAKLKETSENPNVEKLLEKLNEQTLKHAVLFNQLTEKWNTDLYTEDNHLQIAIDIAQKKIQEVVVAAAQKDENIEQKAGEQIKRAEIAISALESELAEFAINEPGVPNNKSAINANESDASNTTIERQTPKRDFGDRIKAGLETAAGILINGKVFFTEGKFGEAFGQARAAEVIAINQSRVLNGILRADTEGLEDAMKNTAPPMPNIPMPIVPGPTNEKISPETKGRVFPETNNRTACDDRAAPACPRGEISECYGGKWVCIGPATSGGIILTPAENQSTGESNIKSAE